MGDRYDLLQPAAVEAALRSLPRRFDRALAHLPVDPADRERLLTLTDVGRGVGEALAGVVPALAGAEENVRRLVHRNDASLVAPLAPKPLAWRSIPEESARVGAAAERLADLLRGLHVRDWNRSAAGSTATTLDVARDAVRRAVEALRRIESALGVEPD